MVKNFLFHRVSPDRNILWDPMDPVLFNKCIRYITSQYEVVLLEDLVSQSLAARSGKRLATIVFDDGYKDNIEYAAPILKKYAVKASFYVVTDCIERNIPTWTHMLDHAFQSTAKKEIALTFDFLPQELRVNNLSTMLDRINYVRKLKPALKKISHEQRCHVINVVLSSFTDIQVPSFMLNWDDLRELKKDGHYIGSHTVSHCMLGTMTNEEEITRELTDSGKKIEQELGYFPQTISYPVGSYDQTTIRLSKEAGYQMGLAVKQEAYDPIKNSVYEIPRIELYNEPWLKTRLRMNGMVSGFSKLIRRQ